MAGSPGGKGCPSGFAATPASPIMVGLVSPDEPDRVLRPARSGTSPSEAGGFPDRASGAGAWAQRVGVDGGHAGLPLLRTTVVAQASLFGAPAIDHLLRGAARLDQWMYRSAISGSVLSGDGTGSLESALHHVGIAACVRVHDRGISGPMRLSARCLTEWGVTSSGSKSAIEPGRSRRVLEGGAAVGLHAARGIRGPRPGLVADWKTVVPLANPRLMIDREPGRVGLDCRCLITHPAVWRERSGSVLFGACSSAPASSGPPKGKTPSGTGFILVGLPVGPVLEPTARPRASLAVEGSW